MPLFLLNLMTQINGKNFPMLDPGARYCEKNLARPLGLE